MGLPGSGKTTLSKHLASKLNYNSFNADEIRAFLKDWDFSDFGRDRQLKRMIEVSYSKENTICDFVCPFESSRSEFSPDFLIWMNTIKVGRFEDTNNSFQKPLKYNLMINSFTYNISDILNKIKRNE